MISDARTAVRPLLLAALLSTAALSLSACAPDRRRRRRHHGGGRDRPPHVGTQLEDQNMAFKAQHQISRSWARPRGSMPWPMAASCC